MGRCRDSFRLTGTLRCGRGTVTLPRLGVIRTHESTRKLARRLEDGTARILSATVSRTAQRWHVSFTVEVDRAVPDRHPRPGTAIGIDLGVKSLLTGADDTGRVITVPGPRPLRAGLRRLRRAARAHARKKPGSAGRRKAAARLARLHARVANLRADALHKATSMLAARYETIVVEDLNVAGMTRNRRLARAIADQGFGTARRMLAYKTAWQGGTLVLADRWYPVVEDVLGLRHGESQAGPVRAHLPVRWVRPGPGPGRERRPEPAVPRRQWGGEAKRRGRDRKTAPRAARPAEPGTRHPARGQDRDRRPATGGCGMSAPEHSTATDQDVVDEEADVLAGRLRAGLDELLSEQGWSGLDAFGRKRVAADVPALGSGCQQLAEDAVARCEDLFLQGGGQLRMLAVLADVGEQRGPQGSAERFGHPLVEQQEIRPGSTSPTSTASGGTGSSLPTPSPSSPT